MGVKISKNVTPPTEYSSAKLILNDLCVSDRKSYLLVFENLKFNLKIDFSLT